VPRRVKKVLPCATDLTRGHHLNKNKNQITKTFLPVGISLMQIVVIVKLGQLPQCVWSFRCRISCNHENGLHRVNLRTSELCNPIGLSPSQARKVFFFGISPAHPALSNKISWYVPCKNSFKKPPHKRGAMPTLSKLLREDHNKVKELFEEFEHAERRPSKRANC